MKGSRAVSEGRRHEFAAFGWKPEDVPDPTSPETFARSKLDWSEPEREPHRDLLQDIDLDDVHWIAERLASLSPEQWDDALRAAGYSGEQASLIRRTLDARITQGRRL